MKKLALLSSLALSVSAQAVVISFDFQGNAGTGLLTGNENPAVTTSNGSGGETGAGLTFDTDTNILNLNAGWGSGNGFNDLTGTVTAIHLHDAGDSNFSSNGGVVVNLGNDAGFNSSGTNGGIVTTLTLTDAVETSLLAGQIYLNVHTAANGGGEIRANLVQSPVPEPSSLMLSLVGLGLLTRRRR